MEPMHKKIKVKFEEIAKEQETQNQAIEDLKKKTDEYLTLIENSCNTIEDTGSNLNLNNTVKARFKKFRIEGNSTQETSEQGKNLFDASKIKNDKIQVSGNGKTITMPIVESGVGETSTKATLKELCPNLKVGDEVYLFFLSSGTNNIIYLTGSRKYFIKNTKITISKEDLQGNVSLYANRASDGETTQIVLTDFMITKENDSTWEPFTPNSPSPDYPSEIKNVSGNVDIKVGNGNIAKINETSWELTENNTIKNKGSTEGKYLIENIPLKAGQIINLYLKLMSKPTATTTFTSYFNGSAMNQPSVSFLNFQGFNLNQIYKRTYIATEDGAFYIRSWGNSANDTFEFQFWASTGELEEYKIPETKSITFPLKENQVLHKGDYLANDGVHQVRTEYTVTGNEPVYEYGANYGIFAVYWRKPVKCPASDLNFLCDRLKAKSISNLKNREIGIAVNNDNYLYVNLTGIAVTIEEVKERWKTLAGMKIQYVPTEEIIVPYSEEQQEAYDQLMELTSYEDTTHIFSEDEIPPIFNIIAYAKGTQTIQVQSTQSEPSMSEMQEDSPSMEEDIEVEGVEE